MSCVRDVDHHSGALSFFAQSAFIPYMKAAPAVAMGCYEAVSLVSCCYESWFAAAA